MEKNGKVLAIIGSQYGDEGKGKFVDLLSQNFDYIVRYQGGDNAGHTIAFNGETFKLRLTPSGVFNKKNKVIIANGTVVNLKTLFEEMQMLTSRGISVNNLFISDRAHLIIDYHIQMDKLNEEIKKKDKIGTTLKGIGPCYADKINRIGIRVCDLFDKENLVKKFEASLVYKNILFEKFNYQLFDPKKLANEYYEYGQKIKHMVIDSITEINKAYKEGKKILLEGAQGVFLDVDFGTYPYVTSSSVVGLLTEGTGLSVDKFKDILGIAKSYSTRVGEGTFVSEILDEKLAHIIRERGHEYGTVTKRPRRVGWLDLVLLKHSIQVAGFTQIALTLLDVLSGHKEIKLCTKYLYEGKEIDYIPSTITEYSKCQPIYETLPGWDEDITNCKSFNELPTNCKKYIEYISNTLNVKIKYISVGADREQTIEAE